MTSLALTSVPDVLTVMTVSESGEGLPLGEDTPPARVSSAEGVTAAEKPSLPFARDQEMLVESDCKGGDEKVDN